MFSLIVADTAFAFYVDFGFRRQVRQNVLAAACGPVGAQQVDNVLGCNPNGERRTFQVVGTTSDPLIRPGTCPQRQT